MEAAAAAMAAYQTGLAAFRQKPADYRAAIRSFEQAAALTAGGGAAVHHDSFGVFSAALLAKIGVFHIRFRKVVPIFPNAS